MVRQFFTAKIRDHIKVMVIEKEPYQSNNTLIKFSHI